jgi:hypothetical protein
MTSLSAFTIDPLRILEFRLQNCVKSKMNYEKTLVFRSHQP